MAAKLLRDSRLAPVIADSPPLNHADRIDAPNRQIRKRSDAFDRPLRLRPRCDPTGAFRNSNHKSGRSRVAAIAACRAYLRRWRAKPPVSMVRWQPSRRERLLPKSFDAPWTTRYPATAR